MKRDRLTSGGTASTNSITSPQPKAIQVTQGVHGSRPVWDRLGSTPQQQKQRGSVQQRLGAAGNGGPTGQLMFQVHRGDELVKEGVAVPKGTARDSTTGTIPKTLPPPPPPPKKSSHKWGKGRTEAEDDALQLPAEDDLSSQQDSEEEVSFHKSTESGRRRQSKKGRQASS